MICCNQASADPASEVIDPRTAACVSRLGWMVRVPVPITSAVTDPTTALAGHSRPMAPAASPPDTPAWTVAVRNISPAARLRRRSPTRRRIPIARSTTVWIAVPMTIAQSLLGAGPASLARNASLAASTKNAPR
jgi:hypothetical protein